MSPLAPTKLTDLASELENRRQRSIEPEVDRVRRELEFEPLEPQNIEPREDRDHECLAAVWPGVGPQAGQRAGVVDDLEWRKPSGFHRFHGDPLFGVEPTDRGLPRGQVTGLAELPRGVLAGATDPGDAQFVRPRPMRAMESDDLADRGVVDVTDLGQERPDRVLIPGLWIRMALDPAVVAAPATSANHGDRRPEGFARMRGVTVSTRVAVQVAATARAAEAERGTSGWGSGAATHHSEGHGKQHDAGIVGGL